MKKLSIAFYWHMHQPVYEVGNTYLMPWARLHAVKDYLDMGLFLDKFPKLKLNFNVVPALVDTIIDYANGVNDIHSDLTVASVENMTDEEKSFILNNFFSAQFETMLYKSKNYETLYNKRFGVDTWSIHDFSNQEYSDLMALFNLVWIDPIHYSRYPELQQLWEKQYNYTLEDRIKIIEIQKTIIREIIPTFKKYIKDGRVELTTSPYYHPILPILINTKNTLKQNGTLENLPASLNMVEDAHLQIKMALDRMEEIFEFRPKGIWPPELCICPKTLSAIANEGVKWVIADEGTLSDSIKFDFIRDFKGNLNDPYYLLKVFNYKNKDSSIDMIFRDRSLPGLINFEYAGVDAEMAAKDLYNKIKTIQDKILISPDDSHMLTIALDGENCWENYQNDGNDFLENIYKYLENDETLETVLISEYVEKDEYKKRLDKVSTGSWIDKTFNYWIGEVTKNKAWQYLSKAKHDFVKFTKGKPETDDIKLAKREILIAQGSDWFWWYGEPNNSGQDYIFDYMFREHLKNVYHYLGLNVPEVLNNSLITKIEIPFKRPSRQITPRIDGLVSSQDDWIDAGLISLVDGPVYRENKNVDKIFFGCDSDNLYLRLYVSKNSNDTNIYNRISQFYIYSRNATNIKDRAFIRLISKADKQYPIMSEKFEHELTFTFLQDMLYPPRLSACLHQNLWTLVNPESIVMVYNDVIDVVMPFDTLGIQKGETIEFFMANTESGVKNTDIAQEFLLSLKRQG